ncbi:11202_t:CDS:10 [Funneliformis geosporum]|uniref:3601_t:CDS:1 n=1 Tax=Funneliformis geosporum TaxID=1117311 RepID=A0A9W4SHJ7_9GLOM|nr:11202_t:CDS:10 [Funneliformis geosporum]CAI2169705.1 3601_t:CDS:10 [Funneliformis geosporum]
MVLATEVFDFPKNIEGFGYKFNENGELRHIETNERFLFVVKPDDRSYNQNHYEALGGTVIGEFIEEELVNKYNLIRKTIPVESDEDEDVVFPKSRIYLSEDAQDCQNLLLLIQGSGVVRPGQWARQVIINDSLELGTMFPYIKKAQDLKWGIIIFNPNANIGRVTKNGEVIGFARIKGSESPQDHCLYVWDRFVRKTIAKRILIVAHSFGGICTSYMIDHFANDFRSRVKGIALTDSVHSFGMIPKHSDKWFRGCTTNWIKSPLPLNEPVREANGFYGCHCTSAGHPKHEYTSGAAIEPVFEFLQGRLAQAIEREKKASFSSNESEKIAEKSSEATISTLIHETSKIPHEINVTNITNKGNEQSVANGEGETMEMSNESTQTREDIKEVDTKTQEQPSQTLEKINTIITKQKDEQSIAYNESEEMEIINESLESGMNLQTQEPGQVSLEQGTEAITIQEDNQLSGANNNDGVESLEAVTSTQPHESNQMPPEEIITTAMEIDESPESVINVPKKGTELNKTLVNDEFENGEYKKENNTSENQFVTTKDLPKEMSTGSTDVQHSNDEIIQDNNNKEKTDNSLTSDQKNNVKQESEYKI